MTGPYAHIPAIWTPLLGAIFVAAVGLCVWQRRDMPAVAPFLACSLFASLMALTIAAGAAAVTMAAKITWYKWQFLFSVLAVTSGTCFSLEYAYPGRWLTRRNLALLAIPPLVLSLLIVTNDARLAWLAFEIGPYDSVMPSWAVPGAILMAYAVGLVLINVTVFAWLFIRSPQHRWPVAIMVCGQILGRSAYLAGLARLPTPGMLDPVVLAILAPWSAYAIALFGFRIFDPLPAARQAVLQQMHAGVVVFDAAWRIICLNPAAEAIFGVRESVVRGKTWQQLSSAGEPLPDLPGAAVREGNAGGMQVDEAGTAAGAAADQLEMTFGEGLCAAGVHARYYAPSLSELRDFRGPLLGHLLMLRDVTEQHSAQARLLEQQNALATLRERERLARELHDNLGQVFAFVSTQGQTVRRLLARGKIAAADEYVARLVEVARDADTDIRESILGLRVGLAGEGLAPALASYLQQYEARCGIHTELAVADGFGDGALDLRARVQLLRIVQEALSNTRKHAHATSVRVALVMEGGCARVTIQDDGTGFEPPRFDRSGASAADAGSESAGHIGLRVMCERAEEIGGTLEVQSPTGAGTTVTVSVPLEGQGLK
jgi:signal transduction histidine kinase